jgi:hypothetical protein
MIRRRQIILALWHFLQRSRRVRGLDLKHTLAFRRLRPASRSNAFILLQRFELRRLRALDVERHCFVGL